MQQAMNAEQAEYHFWIQDAIELARDAERERNHELELAYRDLIDECNQYSYFYDINR